MDYLGDLEESTPTGFFEAHWDGETIDTIQKSYYKDEACPFLVYFGTVDKLYIYL